MVVGGGALGCAVAFWVARAGVRVTLIERDPPGQHASAKNAGNLNPLFMTPPPLIPFALESFRLHLALAEELATLLNGARYAVEPVRRLLISFDESDSLEFENVIRLFAGQAGFSIRQLEVPSVCALEPRVSKDAQGALLMEGNRCLNAQALTSALADGAARLGGTIMRAGVRELKTASGRVTAVKTQDLEIACDAIVLATGPWIAKIEQWVGLSLPVKPVKGQLLRMKLPGEGLRYDLTHGIAGLYRRNQNEVWVGGTQEDAGLDETPTEEIRHHLLEQAVRIMPEMAQAQLLEHVAALRPVTPSGLPIVEQASGWSNVYIANGGCSKGILLCTGIAQALRDLMLNGQTTMPLNFQNT